MEILNEADSGFMEGIVMTSVDSSTEEENAPLAPNPDTEGFTTTFKIDAAFLKFVTGKGEKTKQKIENESATEIYVPTPHEAKQGSFVVIKGPSQEKVDEAVSKLSAVLQEAEESRSVGYTHFISLPLALHPALKEKVTKFHNSVLYLSSGNNSKESVEHPNTCLSLVDTNEEKEMMVSASNINEEIDEIEKAAAGMNKKTNETTSSNAGDSERETNADVRGSCSCSNSDAIEINVSTSCDIEAIEKTPNDEANLPSRGKRDSGIEDSIFIKTTRLHMTVLMLKLWNKERVDSAADILQEVTPKVLEALDRHSISIRLKGLDCMKGNPKKAHVLHASVEESEQKDRLIKACYIIRNAFMEAGLVSQTEYNRELKLHVTLMNTSHRKRKKGKRFSKRIPFDARDIISKHGSEDWGEHMVMEAHLSQRFAYDKDGYYRCCGSIQFPLTPTLALPL